MVRTQIYLTADEDQGLNLLSRLKGRSKSDIIREAIDNYLSCQNEIGQRSLMRLAGIWKDREDVPDIEKMRREWRKID